jgi:hypothetical protein
VTSEHRYICSDDGSSTAVSQHEDIYAGMAAVKHRVEDFGYGLYAVGVKVASFAEGGIGYREWARRRGYIHSIDDHYEHDVDDLMQ